VTLLAVERIKLFSTRSPWWCLGLTAVIMVGFSALIAGLAPAEEVTVGTSLVAYNFGLMILLVMSMIAVTNEYRFSTIRATFAAVPNRTAVLGAKMAVVALVTGLLGEALAFAAWGMANLLKPTADLTINTAAEWRFVLGIGLVFALSSLIAVGIGVLVRQTAAGVALLLVWTLLVESLIGLIPRVGDNIQDWMPWIAANHFLTEGNGANSGEGAGVGLDLPYGAWGGLAYFAGIAVAVVVVALFVAERRDA
jgi:ABC-2 type transport system permease protein